ncbi:MAG: hypothetical protein C0594_15270 [Marinilabiliales bacterium]|nr:MAG: hypothetical protein C0594_15270 [Marinilabiliales bacterium]
MERKCLECGDSFTGRADKKFCSDQCRNTFNNKLNSDTNNYVRNINNILRKNRRILDGLTPNGKSKVKRTKLESMGFNFNYHTHIYTTKKGSVYYFCYEFGYLPIEDDYFALVKREDYRIL